MNPYDWNRSRHLTEVFRFLRIIKIVKLVKYIPFYTKFLANLGITVRSGRLVLLTASSILLAHVFACLFYIASKYNNF
jgi:hypothetical protein